MRKERLIKTGLLIVAVTGILDSVLMRSRSGSMDFGIILPGMGGLAVLLVLMFMNSKYYTNNKRLYDKIGKYVLKAFTAWFISFIIVAVVLITSAVPDGNMKVDCVIVLGAGLKGETPTLTLVRRLDKALGYIAENPGTRVIVSGGKGMGESISEAEGMKRYLVQHGVSEALIMKEEKSTSTYENMLFSKGLYNQKLGRGPESVLIITNDFHMFRAKLLARRVGLRPYGISAGTPWYIYPNVFLREYLAVFKSLAFDR